MYRIGQGFDCHRFEVNRKLILGGVEIPYEKGLAGHSDADVLIHSIIDSILGALSLGDIGELFPPSDEKFKNINSKILLLDVLKLLDENQYKISNIDNTIICEEPNLKLWKLKIRESLAEILSLEVDRISVKAKTAEKMGAIGAKEGIAVLSTVLLHTKW